jgi:hypothetical protein
VQGLHRQVKATYLRIGKPRSLRAAGTIFFGTPYRMGTSCRSAATRADAELWITMEGWDGRCTRPRFPWPGIASHRGLARETRRQK